MKTMKNSNNCNVYTLTWYDWYDQVCVCVCGYQMWHKEDTYSQGGKSKQLKYGAGVHSEILQPVCL